MYQQQFNPYAANVAIVKGYFKSGNVLFVGILYILSAILGIVNAVVTISPASSYYNLLLFLDEMGLSASEASLAYSIFSFSFVFGVLISTLITVLMAVGFIIIFAKSRSASPNSTPIAGVNILYVLATISFVCSIILTVVLALFYLMLIVIFMTSNRYSNLLAGNSIASLIIVGVILALFIFLLIFSTAKCRAYYRSVKYSLTTVKLHYKGATAWGVLNLIYAVCILILLICMFIGSLLITNTSFSSLSNANVVIVGMELSLSANIALGYSRYIKRQSVGYNNTPYGGTPAYAPAPNNQPVYRAQPAYQQPQPAYQNPVFPQNAPAQNQPQPSYNDNFTETPAPVQAQNSPVCPICGAAIDEPTLPFCGNCGNKILTKE